MTGSGTYLCRRDGLIVRVDQRAAHEASHAAFDALQAEVDGITLGATTRLAFQQSEPAAQWIWQHNLGGYPPITLFSDDDPQVPCFTDLTYTDPNTVLIDWPEPTTGWAYI